MLLSFESKSRIFQKIVFEIAAFAKKLVTGIS
jgi:hypothetical protein